MENIEELEQELQDLKESNRLLELSDDSLFLNANGNLPKYDRNQQKIAQINKQLELMKGTKG